MIIGCDYSTKAIDLAQRRDGDDWRHLKLHAKDFDQDFLRELDAALKFFAAWKDAAEELVIYIERPWIGMAGKQAALGNPMTSMQLIKVSTAVQVIAMQNCYRVEWAHPSSWRSKVFGKGRWPKAIAKARSIKWAQENTNLRVVDDNVADACCIAAFGEMQEYGS